MSQKFQFNEHQFNNLFPFYLLINRELKICSIGKSIHRLCRLNVDEFFVQHFTIPRPFTPIHDFKDLIQLKNQLVVIESRQNQKMIIRGQFEHLEDSEEILFIGSPWVNSIEQITENNLTINDFAHHDPSIDLLHVLKAQDITNEDLKKLVVSFNKQKEDLKRANKEIHDIALFPTQNPDPLIRINFEGDILLNNPAASLLDFFVYDGKVLRNDEFFKIIADKIDKGNNRWNIEAKSGEQIFSFVCVSMISEGYINIYGRNITEWKKTQDQISRLSLVASANKNGVVFTNTSGYITWANEGFCNLTGYSIDEIIGKSPIELCSGALTNQDTLSYILDCFFKGLGFTEDILYYKKDGSCFWGRSFSQPLRSEDGNISEFFGIIQDITHEKESEHLFKRALQSIGDNVWEHDFQTGTTIFSKSNNDFLGFVSNEIEDYSGLWWSRVHDEDLPILIESDKQYKEKKAESHSLEYRIIHKDGSVRWVLDRGVVIQRDATGNPLKIIGTHTDITRSKQNEIELENRVKQFQSLSENIPGVIYEFVFRKDASSGLNYISPAIEKIFGILPDDFKNYLEYIHPEDREMVVERNRYSRETLSPFYVEARLVIPGQPIRWHSVHSSYSYQTEEGDIVFTGFILDITDRKNVEQQLDEQRRFYEGILNNMPADIAVFNTNHEYLFVNPMGIKDEALRKWIIGKKDEDYCIYRNKPFSTVANRRTSFQKVIETKQPHEWEEHSFMPDGSDKHILRRWYPVMNGQNEVAIVIGYGIDITERRRMEDALRHNEEKYRSIIENMNLGLIEVDMNGVIHFANQTLLRMTNEYESAAFGNNIYEFVLPEYLDILQKRIGKTSSTINEAFEIQTKMKTHKWWLVSTAIKYDNEGNQVGNILICLDITPQKQLEKDLIKSREQAEILARTKESFLANMSHEIRTPMNAILGMGNQLAKTDLNEKQWFYLDTIRTATDNLLVIINDILDLSKIDAGKLTIEKIGFEPIGVSENAIRVLMHKAEEKGLKLTNTYYDDRLAKVLLGDPYRVNQILLNLIGNAIKFTEVGSVELSWTVIKDLKASQIIKVSVKDSGIGMDAKFVAQLFDKFSQEYESITRTYGGTGLGMSICKELVELMGGKIYALSEKGKGTTISFEVEFAKGAIDDLPKEKILNSVLEFNFLHQKKILITDDNQMNRLLASIILKNHGADILEASNGKEAIEIIKNEQPDLVLMDIQMPIMNGYDATIIARNEGYDKPIIALTANAVKGENEKCKQAGMNDYMSKPFKEDEFLRILANSLPIDQKVQHRLTHIKEEKIMKHSYFDISGLEELSHGDKDFIKKMLELFIEQATQTINEIKNAYTNDQMEQVKKIAHRIKPSIDTLGIILLKEDIRDIEKNADVYGRSEKMNLLIEKLETVLVNTINEIKNYQ